MRLEQVNQMLVRGARNWQIAEALSTSMRTVARDINRVRELRRRATEQDIAKHVNDSVAQYEAIRNEAWRGYDADKRMGREWLKTAIDAQQAIDKILGVQAPLRSQVEVEHSGVIMSRDLEGLTDAELEQLIANLAGADGGGATRKETPRE